MWPTRLIHDTWNITYFQVLEHGLMYVSLCINTWYTHDTYMKFHVDHKCLPELHYDSRFSLNDRVYNLGERIFSDLHHCQQGVLLKSWAENGRRGGNFVLLEVSFLFYLATKQLEDWLKVCIIYERRHRAKLVVGEFELRLLGFGVCCTLRTDMKSSRLQCSLSRKNLLKWNVSKASKTKMCEEIVFLISAKTQGMLVISA